jgi:hypothetical protein
MKKIKIIALIILTISSSQIQNRDGRKRYQRQDDAASLVALGGIGLLLAAGIYGGYRAYQKFKWPKKVFIELDDALIRSQDKNLFIDLLNKLDNFNWEEKYELKQGSPDEYGQVEKKVNNELKIQYTLKNNVYIPNFQNHKKNSGLAFFKKQDGKQYNEKSILLPCKLYDKEITLNIKSKNKDSIEEYINKLIEKKKMAKILKKKKKEKKGGEQYPPDFDQETPVDEDGKLLIEQNNTAASNSNQSDLYEKINMESSFYHNTSDIPQYKKQQTNTNYDQASQIYNKSLKNYQDEFAKTIEQSNLFSEEQKTKTRKEELLNEINKLDEYYSLELKERAFNKENAMCIKDLEGILSKLQNKKNN